MHTDAITHPGLLQRREKAPGDHTVVANLDGIQGTLRQPMEKFLQLRNETFRRAGQHATQRRKLEQQWARFST